MTGHDLRLEWCQLPDANTISQVFCQTKHHPRTNTRITQGKVLVLSLFPWHPELYSVHFVRVKKDRKFPEKRQRSSQI